MAGLTQTGASATTPSNVDFRFALHTREGVGDRSAIGDELGKQIDYSLIGHGVEAAGRLTKDVYTGYQLGKLQKQITEEAINPFIESMPSSQIVESVGQQKAYADQKQSIFQNFMDTGTQSQQELEQSVQNNAASVTKETNRLQAALKQGQMSQQQFELRVRAITREAINKNPGLSQELLAHAQMVEHQSGVRLIPDIKQQVDKAAEAAQKRQLNFEYAQHARAGTFINPVDYESNPEVRAAKMAETEKVLRGSAYIEQLKQNQLTGEFFDKAEAKENIPKMGVATQAVFHEFISAAHGLAANADTPQKKAELTNQLETFRANKLIEYRKYLSDNNFPRQHVNDHISILDKMTTNVMEAITKDTSGKPLAEIFNTQLVLQKLASELQIRENFPVDTFKFVKSLPPSMQAEFDRNLRNNPDKDKIMSNLFSALSGYNSVSALNAITGRNLSNNTTDATVGFKAAIMDGNNADAEKLIQAIKLHTVDLKSQNFPSDLTEKVKAQDAIITEMAKPEYKGRLNFGATVNKNAMDIARDYLIDGGTLFRRDVDKYNQDPSSTVKIFTRLNKNGQMEIYGEGGDYGSGAKIGQEFQKRYGEAFNRGVRAMANLHGTSWKDASRDLLDAIDQDWYINDPDGSLLSNEDRQARNGYVDKVVKVESNGVATAKNPKSSATGVSQFISSTWNTTIDKYAPELKQGRTTEEILALRNDPEISKQMTQYLAQDNSRILKQNNLPATDPNLYLAHFLGANTAAMVLRVPDKVKLDDLLDEGVLIANANVLRGKTVGDLKQWAIRKMN